MGDEHGNARSLTLSDGRELSYYIYGSTSLSPRYVFYFHSWPASGVEGALFHEVALSYNIRLICPDRPSIGSSTFLPQRRILDWPEDVLALAHHLDISEYVCITTSWGAPYAMACYHKIPRSRLIGTIIVSGNWPRQPLSQRGSGSHGLSSRLVSLVVERLPSLVTAVIECGIGRSSRKPQNDAVLANTLAEMMMLSDSDREVWKDDVSNIRTLYLMSLRKALENGSKGAAHEARLQASDWEFSLQDVKVTQGSLRIWEGSLGQHIYGTEATTVKASMPWCILQ